jgi:hypothetical protein
MIAVIDPSMQGSITDPDTQTREKKRVIMVIE